MPKPILELDPKYGLSLAEEYSDLKISIHEIDGLAIDNAFEVTISTQNTLLFSVGQEKRTDRDEIGNLVKLFQDNKVHETFNDGNPIPEPKLRAFYSEKKKLWESGNPFSMFVIEDKKNGDFVGCAFMESCPPHPIHNTITPGYSNLGAAIASAKQKNNFGTQALGAITYGWAPYVAQRAYQVNGALLSTLSVTTHKDGAVATKMMPATRFKHIDTFIDPISKIETEQYSYDVQEAIEIRENSRKKFISNPKL